MSYHHMMLKGRHLYDPLTKIPLIVKYPGQTDSFLSENIDVAPTVLELCGQPIPPTMQGRSLLGNDHRQFAFSELQFGSRRIRRSATCSVRIPTSFWSTAVCRTVPFMT